MVNRVKSRSSKFVYFCASADKRLLSSGNSINNLLVNVPACFRSEKTIHTALEFIRSSHAKTVMLDSGGYTLHECERKGLQITHNRNESLFPKERFNITPFHVVKAGEALKPDILVALDFPVRTLKETSDQEREFQLKLPYNVRWALESADLKEKYCPKSKLFIPFQCYSFDHLELFFKRINGIRFDGVSMPVRHLNLREISKFLIHFHQLGIRAVHLLGTGSFYTTVLSAYMANRYFDWISLDSTTWNKAAQLGRYLNPDLTRRWVVDVAETHDKEMLTCRCPVCRGKTFFDVINLPVKERDLFLRVHNYSAIESLFKLSFRYCQSVEATMRFLKRTCSNERLSRKLVQCLKELEENKE